MEGIGGCKPRRREQGSAWVMITVIGNEYDVPAQRIITAVQTAIDPEQSHGEGDGLAPICHNVKIEPVVAVPVNVSVDITWNAGYSEGAGGKNHFRRLCETARMASAEIPLAPIQPTVRTVRGIPVEKRNQKLRAD